MPKHPPEEVPEVTAELVPQDDAYQTPADLDEPGPDGDGGGDVPPAWRRSPLLTAVAALAVVLVIGGALLAYRAYHRRKVIAEGLARADALLRLDTAAGYREAATLLEPIAALDPGEAASVRAFALAMLFADYRAADVEPEIEALLVAPGRADVVPVYAQLAAAALSLGRREAGNAASAASRAGDGAWARTLQARVAFAAGNVAAALDPAASAATEGAFPPGLAAHGDALRRLRRDPAAARAAYEAALAASPLQPRAAYGLAKLALAGDAPAEEATAALQRVLSDAAGTPAQERSRAALHLAALQLRAGNRPAAEAVLDAAALEGADRAWALRAATVAAEHRGPYRAVSGAPTRLLSPSDDDPGELSPAPPPPPPPPREIAPEPVKTKAVAKPGKKAVAKKASKAAVKKAAAVKKTATKKAAAKKPARKRPPAP